jgi:hypothetical protein
MRGQTDLAEGRSVNWAQSFFGDITPGCRRKPGTEPGYLRDTVAHTYIQSASRQIHAAR